jgi:hypothetical protein
MLCLYSLQFTKTQYDLEFYQYFKTKFVINSYLATVP